MNRTSLSTGFLLLFLFSAGIAQERIKAVKFDHPPVIDGRISDTVWAQCTPVTRFTQREPDNGQPFTLETEVYIGYDRENLYIAFRCFGDPDRITAKEMARDVSLGNDDRVQVILDTYRDRRNGYWFQVGPRGSIGDAYVSENGAGFNKAWDGLWTGKASIHTMGWDAEMAIPFKTLGFNRDLENWGLKLIRYNMENQETGYWPEANLNAYRFQVSDAGILEGLEGISQGVGLDLVPYGLTGLHYRRDEGETKPEVHAGFEVYYNLTPNLKAAATVNTDFAQTEVDDREINLTRFNLFYPEKRDFFLDGSNYFDFGINGDSENKWNTRMIPFFSRRIGLDSAGNPIPVQYGSKVTGQAGSWNIGAMYMKDRRDRWENSQFAVTRISRNFSRQSQVGLISTYGNSLRDEPNALLGFDVKLATSRFRGNKNMGLTLYGLKSFSPGAGQAGGGKDLAYGVEFVYPNDLISLRLGHMQIQEQFTAGLGFVPRPGVRQTYGELLAGPRPNRWGILQVSAGPALDHLTGFDGRLLTREWTFIPLQVRFRSGDELGYRIVSAYEFLEAPFPIYNGTVIPSGTYQFRYHTISGNTARRRKFWTAAGYRFGGFFNGTRNEIKLETGYKVAVPLFIGGEWIRNDVQLGADSFVAHIYRLNLNILFSPDITLYNFVQYDSQSGKTGWQSRFQWIIRPGKEVFLVWNSISSASPLDDRLYMEEATARLKVKFTFRF